MKSTLPSAKSPQKNKPKIPPPLFEFVRSLPFSLKCILLAALFGLRQDTPLSLKQNDFGDAHLKGKALRLWETAFV